MIKILLLLLLLLLGACSHKVSVVDKGCYAFALIYPSRADTLDTKRQIYVHNDMWEKTCKRGEDER